MNIDGNEWVRADSVGARPKGDRVLVVVDRGWIFAGDVCLDEESGRVLLENAVHVLRWESIGFAGLVAGKSWDKVTVNKLASPVDIPEGSEIFRVPVESGWGLET